ncbi:antitoxin [Actinokineospora pegani]|uniref:antitoxin n=1 Tax=Actinokineospora pegani TaxID=2654637 RepID=UPI0012EA3834|nr:antitoxin [Actinokineospora pegani]
MNLDDLKNKAKEALGKNPDKAEQGVDKAGEAAKGRFGQHSDKIDSATEKAKEHLRRTGGNDQQPPT